MSRPRALTSICPDNREAHPTGHPTTHQEYFHLHDIGQARRLSADVIFLNRGLVIEYSDAAPFFSLPTPMRRKLF